MAASGAFSEYSSAALLEAASLPPTGSARNPLVALTRGLTSVLPPRGVGASGAAPPAAAAAQQPQRLTLPDGHLNVGTHLPLLAGRYKYLSTLGEGVSSRVILAEDTLAPTPGRLVAVKIMRRQHAAAGQREARALRYLHGSAPGGAAPGVVRLLDSFSLGAHYCLVTERLFPWLLDWIADSSALPAAEALAQLRKIAHQLLVAVAFLHNCGLVNGDIKPDNLLLQHPPGSSSVGVRLVDFGACFSLTETDTQAVGCEVQTLPWRAPEAALGLPYGAAIDCWGCGVVLAEMALRRLLLPCATPRDLLHQMASLLGPLPESLVDASPLGQQLDLFALCRSAAGGSSSAAAAGRALPPELAQRAAAAAAAATPQQQAPPPRTATSPLYAELAAVDPQLADLVLGLLAYDPAQRLTAHQALLHPFFDPICPLRAVFPQLGAPCRVQQAALLSESAAAAAAAGPTVRGAVAAGGPTSGAAARTAAGAAGPSRWHPGAPPRLAVAPQPPAAALRQAAGTPGSAAAAMATAAGVPAGSLAGAKPVASPLARGHAGMPSPEAVSAAAAAEAAAALDAALASAAVAALPWSARRQQLGAAALPAAAAEVTQQQTMQQQRQQQQRQPMKQPERQQQAQQPQAQHAAQHEPPPQRPLPSQASHAEPWRKLSAALAQPVAPQSRLPAVQLAAQIAAEQRQLAAANPYAGSFSPHFEGETPLKQSPQAEQPQPRPRQQQPAVQQREQGQHRQEQTPAGQYEEGQEEEQEEPRWVQQQQRPLHKLLGLPTWQQAEQPGKQLAAGGARQPSAAKPTPASRSRKAQHPAADGTAGKPHGSRRSSKKPAAAAAAAAAAAGPTKPAAGEAVAERRDGSSRQRQRKAAAADAAAAARRAEEQAEDGARASDLLLEAAAVEDGIDDWAAGPAGPAGRTAGQGKHKQPPASAKKPRKQPAGAAAAAAAAADGLPAAAAKPQPAKRQRPKQPKQQEQQPEEQAQLEQPKSKPPPSQQQQQEQQQQQRPKQPRQEQPQVARPHSAAASSAKPPAGAGGGAAAGGGGAPVPGTAGSKAGSSKKPRPQAAPAAKRPPEGQQAAQGAAQQQLAAAAKPRKQPAAAATPAAQQPGGARPAAAPKRKRETPASEPGDAACAAVEAAEAPASPHTAVAPTAAEPTIPATAKRQRRERPPDAKPWWCV